jgi:hypothetical protein
MAPEHRALLQPEQLRISDLRKLLEQLESQHGDLLVTLADADSGVWWRMQSKHLQVNDGRLFIEGDYGDEEDLG